MNNESINYPFLAGYLEAIINNLSLDRSFVKMNECDRVAYVRRELAAAKDAAKVFAERYRAS